MLELWPPSETVVVRAHGLVLREWGAADVDALVALFDTAEMDRWTPLASPFDRQVAREYVTAAHRGRQTSGSLQLAVTEDGVTPLGEVLVFPGGAPGSVELAYAVGAGHQGRGLARRAVAAVVDLAAAAGASTTRLVVATDNVRSNRVAAAAGFRLTDLPLTERRRKGYLLSMATWERPLRTDA